MGKPPTALQAIATKIRTKNMIPMVHPNIGNIMGQTYSVIPKYSKIMKAMRNDPPNAVIIEIATFAKTLLLNRNH